VRVVFAVILPVGALLIVWYLRYRVRERFRFPDDRPVDFRISTFDPERYEDLGDGVEYNPLQGSE
jgi:hypothetical protein